MEIGLDSRMKSDYIFHGPSLFATSAILRISGSAYQEEDATQLQVRKTSWQGCHSANFPDSDYVFWVLLIYSFHAPFHPSSRNTKTPIKAIPLRPGPCRKGPIIAPMLRVSLMITGFHDCALRARAQLACICPPTAGGRWRR